ncbi:MAG: peptidoglycan DD-metalloendopeptidase family protein [Clostridia bacterium]|nr:peptidoglycan DD-metalloendopeptidase family protein [Clostridia bacterium]
MSLKYKIVYKVTISGEEVGYVSNKYKFEKLIDEQIINKNEVNVAYVNISEFPKYQIILANNSEKTNEEEIFKKINEEAVTTYKLYEIAVEGNVAVYVNSIEEAEETVAKLKEENTAKMDKVSISVNEIYTQDINNIEKSIQIASNIETAEVEVLDIVNKQEKIKSSTLNGVYFGVKPVSGTITSRYGANESIRDHTHKGMDIAAPYGTTIVAAADGKVTYSGTMGGYGNLIIITHENGIQTYYGHCSKLIAKVGEEVKAGEEIAKVGSTGFSTGNHLHFEIRKNGSQINPQKYLYK